MKIMSSSNSPHNAVEDAIDLSKQDVNSNWNDLIRKTPTTVKRWVGGASDKKSDDGPQGNDKAGSSR